MTSAEARKHVFRPGYWLVNVAHLFEKPDWQEQVKTKESGLLFGYPVAEFMAKQYK